MSSLTPRRVRNGQIKALHAVLSAALVPNPMPAMGHGEAAGDQQSRGLLPFFEPHLSPTLIAARYISHSLRG
jgi:hypothetical protein